MRAARSRVGVRELRQNLSVYLARVKRGETLTVTEHRQVVAILRPAPAHDALQRLVAEGRATAATRRFGELPPTPRVRLRVPLSKILDELSEDTV
jgi:antitoxin (DNA-binding transcriptional repressor) of toxin-antitoxin stability system